MQLGSIFVLVLSIVAGSASPTISLPEVKYGSDTAHAALRVLWNCQIDPGHACGGLATICVTALTNSDAGLLSRITSCTGMALWCGTHATLKIMYCLGVVPLHAGDPKGNDPQSVINGHSNYAGSTFTQDVQSLYRIQDNIVDDTMIKLTGSTATALPASTNNNHHQVYHQFCITSPGFICGYLGVECVDALLLDATANLVRKGSLCGAASVWCIVQVIRNEIACPSEIRTTW